LCPICREQKPFLLQRIGSARHFYYVSLGQGEFLRNEGTCQDCGVAIIAEPTTYASISKTLLPLADLARQTFPNFEEVRRERLALEKKVQSSPLSLVPQDRHALIRTPFLLLSPRVDRRYASTHIDKEIALSFVAALMLLFIGPALVREFVPAANHGYTVLLFLFLGIVLVGWQFVASGPRFLRRQVVPILAKGLRPLQPTEGELRTVLTELKELRHKIGAKMKLADLTSHLQISPFNG
jgi:hypothetical protein